MHFVHYNQKYGSVANAVNFPDGLAVVGIFFELAEEETRDGTKENFKLIRYLQNIQNGGDTSIAPGFSSIEDLIQFPVTDYYTYQG